MSKKGGKATPPEAAAGRKNLQTWLAAHPERGAFRHGAFSQHMRERFSDGRSKEGRVLRAAIRSLIDDLGGQDGISSGQRLLIDTSIRPKLITLICIADWVDRQSQETIVSEKGELAKCLSTNYLAFTNSLRLDLLALYGLTGKKPSRIPTIEELISKGSK
jgi:hypothetical protein